MITFLLGALLGVCLAPVLSIINQWLAGEL